MMEWYYVKPVDTLYFKGAEPMNLGENHTASHIFPPPVHTLSGALRTAVLVQKNISFKSYGEGKADQMVIDAIGEAGKDAPFQVIGPLFKEDKDIYVPAPYSWFSDKDSDATERPVVKAKPVKSRLLKSGTPDLLWAKADKSELSPLGGMWININDLHSTASTLSVRTSESFYDNEPRTGIALEPGRKVREGRLYSFNHARLKKNVSLVFGTDKPLPLAERGTFKIGAEQRFCWYVKRPELITGLDFSKDSGHYLSLSIVEGNEQTNAAVVATGKTLYFGGWDLKRGFHKPMKGFFPAGTVFNKRINHNLIAIKGV